MTTPVRDDQVFDTSRPIIPTPSLKEECFGPKQVPQSALAKLPIGRVLYKMGLVTVSQVELALKVQRKGRGQFPGA